MVGQMSLDGTWQLKGTDGRRGGVVPYCAPNIDDRTCLEAQVPGQVHLDLMRCGQIDDPRVGTNALKARWVEEQFWIYRRTFTAPPEALVARKAWLVFEGLDLTAEIYLNGACVGKHANAYRPCRLDVTEALRPGENALAVLLDAGLHGVGDRLAGEYDPGHDDSLLHKRMWLRKPQYQFGWDWNPRLINVGIFRPVRLEWSDAARIDQVTVYSDLAEDHSRATVHVRAHLDNATGAPLEVALVAHLSDPDGRGVAEVRQELTLPAGASTQQVRLEVEHPRLWWPRPHGAPDLYRVTCEVGCGGAVVDRAERRTGIRSIRINQDAHPTGGQFFILEVNGQPIFAKGGNWVPADMLYGDIAPERYRRLVDLAVAENFNMLRVWGGGLYLDHTMLDLCDEAGLMVWHDCLFACSQYPAGDVAFLDDVRAEIRYVARELSPHPSLMVWCGNNEIEWGAWSWGYDRARAHADYALYHLEIPRVFRAEDPSRPYWPSSPYSPDGQHPNAPTVGDQHPWHVTLGDSHEDFWAYRTDVSRFPNEGGALGASSPATLRQFLPEAERFYLSPSWEYHDNEMGPRAEGLMEDVWFARWMGLKPMELSLDSYAYYSGLLQSEALREYINNYRRRMFSSASAIFWMYNDSWPVTHGWTTVDYYLRRKVAYHPVRRAFEPVQVVAAVEGDEVLVFGVNDTLAPWSGEARWGISRLDGSGNDERTAFVMLSANAATLLGRFPLAEWQRVGYREAVAYAGLWEDGRAVRLNRIFMAPYREVVWPEAQVEVTREEGRAVFRSATFAWGVCLDPDGEQDLPDDVFDLLPGIPWSFPWPEDRALPQVARVANYRLP
ncbi:MAG: beta-mannosidase [Anaerolineae bacterium]